MREVYTKGVSLERVFRVVSLSGLRNTSEGWAAGQGAFHETRSGDLTAQFGSRSFNSSKKFSTMMSLLSVFPRSLV